MMNSVSTNDPQIPRPNDKQGVTVAFFDMDNMILTCNSAGRYVRFRFRRGELALSDVLRTAQALLQYKVALINHEAAMQRALRTVAGHSEQSMVNLCLEWFEKDIRRFVSPMAQQVIEDHRALGHKVVLLTAATRYIGEPVSQHLHMDGCIATQLEVVEGLFTGHPVSPMCYGEGKIHWAREWAHANACNLENAYFYTDSFTDLPMLKHIAHPVAVNPDPRLKRYARRRHIPVQHWT